MAMLKIQLTLNFGKLQVNVCICVASQVNNCKKAGVSFENQKKITSIQSILHNYKSSFLNFVETWLANIIDYTFGKSVTTSF